MGNDEEQVMVSLSIPYGEARDIICYQLETLLSEVTSYEPTRPETIRELVRVVIEHGGDEDIFYLCAGFQKNYCAGGEYGLRAYLPGNCDLKCLMERFFNGLRLHDEYSVYSKYSLDEGTFSVPGILTDQLGFTITPAKTEDGE